ncbi:MAG: hypothetical protein MI741_15715 [Rhodospirillales bacterium]|nr:hypothetical protein [Rhodospirillales bacterium]
MAESGDGQRKVSPWESAALLVLPVLYVVSVLIMRADAGPFWLWHAIDPSYFYLLDSINLINLTAPGHVAEPGTPLQSIGALVLLSAHGFGAVDAVTDSVLRDPESYLRAISTVLYALNAFGLIAVGFAARYAVGGLLPALIVQTGPFASTSIVHHGLYVKPETLLIFATLLLAIVTLIAVRPGMMEKRRLAIAVLFGVVAGFGIATKASAAPIYILPVFLLWSIRPLAFYVLAAVLSFLFFVLPAAGGFGDLFSQIVKTILGSGYGVGVQNAFDLEAYPRYLTRIFSRPVLFVPVLLSVVALAVAWRRARLGRPVPVLMARALTGAVLAQMLSIIVAIRHPSDLYLVPTLVLSGLTVSLLYGVVSGFEIGSPKLRYWAKEVTAVLFGVFLLAQGVAVAAQNIEMRHWRAQAERIDNTEFAQCARINFRFSSDPTYALFLANHVTKGKLADLLGLLAARNDYWFDVASGTFRDWYGEADLLDVLVDYPCALFRGSERNAMETYIKEQVPGLIYQDACSSEFEAVLTSGVDCEGKLTGG